MATSVRHLDPQRRLRSSSLATYAPGAAFIAARAPAHHHIARPPRRWTRRHPFLTLFLCFVAISLTGVTLVINQALSTVSSMHAVSTPPPSVSMPVLAPDDDAGFFPAATPAASPAATPIASPQASSIATSSPQPTATPTAANLIDTGPARAELEAAGRGYGESAGVIDSIRGGASDVTELAKGAAAASGVSEAELEPITIMLMGVDARDGEAIDVGVNSDVLAVARLDPATGSCRLLNIPRDSRVDLPGYGMSKINHALAVGGIPYQQLVVENFLGITIDGYALIDFNGIITLVDSMGGVTIEITEYFHLLGTTFEPGERTLTGLEALRYSRYRGGPDGDFGRIRRQQQVLRALIEQATTREPLGLVRDILPALENHVRTNLTPKEMVALGVHFRTKCTEQTFEAQTLTGRVATEWDALYRVNLSFVIIDPGEVRRRVAELFGD